MTLHYQLRLEDVLAFNREYYKNSPTYRRMRTRARLMLPVIMLALWILTTSSAGFEWTRTVFFLGLGLLWFFLYPARFDKRVIKYAERVMSEGSNRNVLGPGELILEEDGLHSNSDRGQSIYLWSSVDRVVMADDYLFIFISGNIGFPIRITDVGADTAKAAYDFVTSHMPPKE